jgi:hypothetical protein
MRPTLGTLGIAGAAAGVICLIVPAVAKWFPSKPVATIEEPRADSTVARCFVAGGHVVPESIRRPLWLIKAEAGDGWREVGQIYVPPGTWGSRVCVNNPAAATVRLALILADDRLDTVLNRIVPEPRNQAAEEIPAWLKRHSDMGQQGGRGHRGGFVPLPDGATLVTSLDVHVAGAVDPFASLRSESLYCPASRSSERNESWRRWIGRP